MSSTQCTAITEGTSQPQPCSANFITLNYPQAVNGSSTYFTGIRGKVDSSEVYITGVYNDKTIYDGLIYKGSLNGCGQWYNGTFPSSIATQFYGPNSLDNDVVQIVGTYTKISTTYNGFLYQGNLDWSGEWRTINPQSLNIIPIKGTIMHSVMGNYAVGTYFLDGGALNSTLKSSAFIYGIEADDYYSISIPNVDSIDAYGIWHNGNSSYTIIGGYSHRNSSTVDSYIVDWDSSSKRFSHLKSYTHNNDPSVPYTHFEGITTDGKGGYNIASEFDLVSNPTNFNSGSDSKDYLLNTYVHANGTTFVNIARNPDGTFANNASFYIYTFTYSNGSTANLFSSSNTVYQNNILGVYSDNGIINAYMGTFNESCLINNAEQSTNEICLKLLPIAPSSNQDHCIIKYQGLNHPGYIGATTLTGMRAAADDPNNVLISGYYTNLDQTYGGFIYKALLSNTCGQYFDFNFPSSSGITVNSTRAFGVDNAFNHGLCRVIGDYMTVETGSNHLGFFYHGTVDGVGEWETVTPQNLEPAATIINTNVVCTIGDLIVGSYNTNASNALHGYVYQTNTKTAYSVVYPSSSATAVTGAWYNWFHNEFSLPEYTIVGTYTKGPLTAGFIADWNFTDGSAYNWKSYSADNYKSPLVITKFSSMANDHLISNTTGGYNIVANWQNHQESGTSLVNIQRASGGGFGTAEWIDYAVDGSSITSGASNNNANTVVGFYSTYPTSQYGYIATIPEKCIFSYLDKQICPTDSSKSIDMLLNKDLTIALGLNDCQSLKVICCQEILDIDITTNCIPSNHLDNLVTGCNEAIIDCI